MGFLPKIAKSHWEFSTESLDIGHLIKLSHLGLCKDQKNTLLLNFLWLLKQLQNVKLTTILIVAQQNTATEDSPCTVGFDIP